MRLSEAFEQYILVEIVLAKKADKTRRNYCSTANSFIKVLGDIPIELLSENMILGWRVHCERIGHSPASVSSNLSSLRNVLKYLRAKGHEVIDYRDVSRPSVPQKVPVWLENKEVITLLSVIESVRDKAIVACLYSTGARVSELLSLNRDSIIEAKAQIVGKGDKLGTLNFHPYALKYLDLYLETRKDSLTPLFVSGQRRRITVSRVEQLLHEYSDLAGIEKNVTPHVLRHSFASDMKLNGADIFDIQKQLRHSQISSTMIYTHIADKKKEEDHKKYHSGIPIL